MKHKLILFYRNLISMPQTHFTRNNEHSEEFAPIQQHN